MTPALAALWGCLGGAAVEAFDTADVMRRTGKMPWKGRARQRPIGFGVWLVALMIRLGASAATAAVASAGGLIANPVGAFVIGVGGPVALQAIVARTAIANDIPRKAVPVRSASTSRRREPDRGAAASKSTRSSKDPDRPALEEVSDDA